jgi:hypothetical protein
VKTDDALVPESLSVWVRPAEAEPRVTGGGTFRIGDLPPGAYHVGVAAKGYVPRPPTEVVVQAGRKVAVEIPLARGLELRGIVVEDVDQRPIQGARIDFNGIVQAQSDAYGAFSTGLVPPKALEVVTLTHDDYDRHRVVHPVILEPQNIVLAMGRGKGTVTGRIIPPSDGALPARIQVRNWRVPMAGHEELRRELTLENASSFEIRGVFSGPHVLEVAFPGSTIVSRRIEYDLGSDPTRHVDVDLTGGGAVEGVYTAPSNLVAGRQVHLVDTGNHEVGETRTDEKGRFRFDRVPAGEFAIRMGSRIPPLHTQPFQVEDGRVAQIVVDGQTGRLR